MNGMFRIRARLSPSARTLAVVTMGVAVFVLAAFALAPSADRTLAAHHSSGRATRRATTGRSLSRHPDAVGARQLARARSATRLFMRGYLRFAYGEGPASLIRAASPPLRRQLRQRVLVTPAEQGRQPRVISLETSDQERGRVLATAIIDDGGIAFYAIRVTVRKAGSGWRVSAVDGG
jgi:hypothetical protein